MLWWSITAAGRRRPDGRGRPQPGGCEAVGAVRGRWVVAEQACHRKAKAVS